jgi:hypothetical protein
VGAGVIDQANPKLGDMLRVEVAFPTADERGYGAGEYGSGDYGGSSEWQTWEADVVGLEVTRGRQVALGRPEAGIAALTLQERTPAWAAPRVSVLGRPVRILAHRYRNPDIDEWLVVFAGVVDRADLTVAGPHGAERRWQWQCVDELGVAQTVGLFAGDLVRPAEPLETRVAALLGYLGLAVRFATGRPVFPSIPAAAPPAPVPLQGRDVTSTIAEEAGLSCDSAGRILFASAGGELVVDVETTEYPGGERDGWFGNWNQTSWGQVNSLPAMVGYTCSWSRDPVRNRVTVGQAGAVAVTVEDPASRAANGLQTYGRTDLIVAAAGGAGQTMSDLLARSWLNRYAAAVGRLVAVTFDLGFGLRFPDHPGFDVAFYQRQLAYVLAHLDPAQGIACRLPADETGREWTAAGRILGLRWSLGPHTAILTLTLDAPLEEV